MATKKKAPEKAEKGLRSVLPLVNLPERAVLNLGNGIIISVILDMDNQSLSGTLELNGSSTDWEAQFN